MFVFFPLRFGYLYHIFSLISFCLCDSLIWNLKDFRSLVFLPLSKSFKFCYGLTDWLPAAPILCFNNDRAFRIKLLVSLSWVGVKAILCIRGDSFRAFESASHFFSMKDPKTEVSFYYDGLFPQGNMHPSPISAPFWLPRSQMPPAFFVLISLC